VDTKTPATTPTASLVVRDFMVNSFSWIELYCGCFSAQPQ
jgi:hypothetical protein